MFSHEKCQLTNFFVLRLFEIVLVLLFTILVIKLEFKTKLRVQYFPQVIQFLNQTPIQLFLQYNAPPTPPLLHP